MPHKRLSNMVSTCTHDDVWFRFVCINVPVSPAHLSRASLFSACLLSCIRVPWILWHACSLRAPCMYVPLHTCSPCACSPAYFSMHAASSALFPLMCPCSLVPLHEVTLHTCPLQPCSLHACFHAYVYPEYYGMLVLLLTCSLHTCSFASLSPTYLFLGYLSPTCLFPCILVHGSWFLCILVPPQLLLCMLVTLHLFPARL